jgi:hypothetical protein
VLGEAAVNGKEILTEAALEIWNNPDSLQSGNDENYFFPPLG